MCLLLSSSSSSFHPQPDVFGHVRCKKKKKKKKAQEGEGEERKDSSEGIWLVLIWKYCFTSSELNYWSELAVLREQAERHRQPRWARSGRQICHHDHGEHMNPWSAERCSCPFILQIKSASLLLLDSDFILRGSVSGGECESFETLPLSLSLSRFLLSLWLCACVLLQN